MKRSLVLITLVVLVAGGCGRSSSSGSKSRGTSPPTSAAPSAGDFGTLKAVCGAGDATGATDKGVSPTTITVATMADPGAQVNPGLDQELFDTADAFVGWCNDAGGILGRKLVLHKRDAALFNVGPQMTAACQQGDFALVGNGVALDATGVPVRVGCGLPEIPAFDVSYQAGTAPLSVQPQPTAVDEGSLSGAFRALKAFDPTVLSKFGMLNSNVASVKDSGVRDRAALVKLGYTLADYEELPPFIDNWRPIAENIKRNGVQVLTLYSSPDNFAALYKALSDIGYFPKYALVTANQYDPKLTSQAGKALEGSTGGVYILTTLTPFELADKVPATKQYVDILAKYANGTKPRQLGVNGMSAWLLFAESAKACGSQLTRQCLLDKAKSMTGWTAGGLHVPQNPGNGTVGHSPCFVLLKATAAGFSVDTQITKPDNGIFNCDPANSFKVDAPH